MKRKLALLMAVIMAVSPVSAGFPSLQVAAAETAEADDIAETSETAEEAEASEQTDYKFIVQDADKVLLSEDSEYSMTEGETREFSVEFDLDPEVVVPFYEWASESEDIIQITEDGVVTALSGGTGKIRLDIFVDPTTQISSVYEITVTAAEPEEAETEETAEEAVTGEAAAEETAEATTEEAAAEETAEATTEEAAAEGAALEENAEAEEASTEEAAAEENVEAEETAEEESAETADEEKAAEAADEEETAEEAATEEATAEEAATEEAATEEAASEEETTELIEAEASVETSNAPAKVTTAGSDASTVTTGWVKSGTQYSYIGEDGKPLTGWQTIGKYKYYFDPETCMRVTGINEIDGELYVFSVLGRKYNGPKFVKTSKGNCFVDSDGTLLTSCWRKYYGDWYYFQENGLMKTGKLILNGKIYWLDKNGVRQTGWYTPKNYTYYLDKNGVAATGWKTIDGKRYLFTHNGVMKTGFKITNGRIYYLGPKGNQITGFKTINGSKYYLLKDGTVTKGWKRISRKWYYFKSCKAQTGWLTLGSKKYYLDKNGVMVTGTKEIDGVTYKFSSSGVLIPSTNNYSNTEEFIECIAPLVKKYAPKYNVKVYSPIIAQAILESASGQSSLGKKYNNFFGLKCGTLWTGKSVNLLTGEEYSVGQYTTITAAFRVYDNMEEGVKGYFEFLFKNRTRYNNLIGETDPYQYLVKIKADGYATSSRYVENVYNVIKSYNLTRFDD